MNIEQLLTPRQISYQEWLSIEQYVRYIKEQTVMPWMFLANQLWTRTIPIIWCPFISE